MEKDKSLQTLIFNSKIGAEDLASTTGKTLKRFEIQSLATEICPANILYTGAQTHTHVHALVLDATIVVYCSNFNVVMFSTAW